MFTILWNETQNIAEWFFFFKCQVQLESLLTFVQYYHWPSREFPQSKWLPWNLDTVLILHIDTCRYETPDPWSHVWIGSYMNSFSSENELKQAERSFLLTQHKHWLQNIWFWLHWYYLWLFERSVMMTILKSTDDLIHLNPDVLPELIALK